MADVLKSFIKELSANDPFQEVAKEIPLVKKLIETGYTGRKGKGGFYRMNKVDNKKFLKQLIWKLESIIQPKKLILNQIR